MAEVISFARGAPSADLLPVEAVSKAATRALESDAKRALSYGTGIGHPGLCEWVAERHGGVDPSGVMITNGSLEAGWMLFSHLLGPGDEVVVEQPSYDRTLLMLEKLGVDRIGVPLEEDGIDVDGLEAALADGHRPKLVHVIPNFHNPAGCTLSEAQAPAAGRALGRARLLDLRGRPLPRGPLRRRGAADDARARRGHRREGHPRLLVLEDGQPRRPGRLPDRPRRRDRRARQARQRDLHLPEHAGRVDRLRALPLGRARREHRAGQRGAGRAPRRGRRASSRRRSPRPSSSSPAAATSSGSTSPRAPTPPALVPLAKEEGVGFVAGPDFMLEGGERSLRLSFASVPPGDVPEGIGRLARALETSAR